MPLQIDKWSCDRTVMHCNVFRPPAHSQAMLRLLLDSFSKQEMCYIILLPISEKYKTNPLGNFEEQHLGVLQGCSNHVCCCFYYTVCLNKAMTSQTGSSKAFSGNLGTRKHAGISNVSIDLRHPPFSSFNVPSLSYFYNILRQYYKQ